ncbi:SEC-C domain-containing protein, partial [Patescibacteria group bacterium]|nr:SEC-C domain-containing protein [Patescibacteria group bacterium]
DGEKNLELKEQIQEKMNQYLANLVNTYSPEGLEKVEVEQIINNFCEVLPLDGGSQSRLKDQIEKVKTPQEINDFLQKILTEAYESREKQVGLELMREIEKFVWLQSIDRLWIDHLDAMDNLREGVGLRGYGQQDPLVEYKKEAYTSFEKLMGMIEEEVIKRLFRIQVAQPPPQYQNVQTNIDTKDEMGLKSSTSQPTPSGDTSKTKPGRNDPCPCGSGKKYKKCCYQKYG